MSIIVSCSACNVRLTLGDDRAGDRFECPQCDATIKVPGPLQPPARAPAAPPPPSAEPERTALPPEPVAGRDKRVVAGIMAGVAALLLVAVAVIVFVFSKPAEGAKRDAEPAPTAPTTGAAAPAGAPAITPSEGKPATGTANPQPKADQPSKPDPVTVLPQFSAQFLGSQGQGRRFCIIADYSDSMRGAKLANAKTQLVKTLTELNPEAEYYIFAFHARPEPMPHPTWLKAGAPETEKVKEWAKGLGTHLGTVPLPAFEAAFKLSPPPDVIFFMTDGQFAATVPAKVAELNGTPPKTVVNTILFAPTGKVAVKAGNAEDLLKQIATRSGGTFTRYVP